MAGAPPKTQTDTELHTVNFVNPRHIPPAWITNAATSLVHFPVVRSPGSQAAEAFRGLQSQLYLNWLNKSGGGSVIAVVSPDRQEGRSFIASNLAVLFAQGGSRCLLIDADLRFSRMRELFGLPNEDGLSTMLRDTQEVNSFYAVYAMQGLENLTVMPAGSIPPNPQALLQRSVFSNLVNFAGQSHDVVIIDTPAGSLYNDAQIIARAARGAVLVCRRGVTRTARAAAYARQLENLGVHLIGSIITDK